MTKGIPRPNIPADVSIFGLAGPFFMNLLLNQFFASFTEAGARSLAEYVEEATVNDSTVLFNEEDSTDCFYLVLEGRVELTKKSGDSKQVLIETVEAGDYFGEMGILDGSPRSTRATTRGASRVARIPAVPFLRILQEQPARASLSVFRKILGDLRRSNVRVVREVSGQARPVTDEELGAAGADVQKALGVILETIRKLGQEQKDPRVRDACNVIVREAERAQQTVQKTFSPDK